MPNEGIAITTTQIEEFLYVVEVSNTYTTKCLTVEYYTRDNLSKEEIGLMVFRDLIQSSTMGLVSAGTHEVRDYYKSALTNLKEVMSQEDIWEVKCATMHNA